MPDDIHTPLGDAPVIPLVILGTGMYLAWFGVHFWRSDTKWPTDPVKAVLQGKPVTGGSASAPESAELTADIQAYSGAASTSGGTGNSTQTASATSYSESGVASLWTSLGGGSDTAGFAAKVAMAESGGSATVTSSNPDGGTNVGLFQLDTNGVGAGHTVAELQDAAANTQITIMATANGRNWAQWSNPVVNALPGHYYNG